MDDEQKIIFSIKKRQSVSPLTILFEEKMGLEHTDKLTKPENGGPNPEGPGVSTGEVTATEPTLPGTMGVSQNPVSVNLVAKGREKRKRPGKQQRERLKRALERSKSEGTTPGSVTSDSTLNTPDLKRLKESPMATSSQVTPILVNRKVNQGKDQGKQGDSLPLSQVVKPTYAEAATSKSDGDGESGVKAGGNQSRKRKRKSKSEKPEKVVHSSRTESCKKDFWVALVIQGDRDYSFSKAELERQQALLNAAIMAAVMSGEQPKSEGVIRSTGKLVVRCADQTTSDWLRRVAPTWDWEGKRLEAIPVSELPKLARHRLFVPDLPGIETSVESVLTLLRGQNQGLLTERWSVFSSRRSGPGVLVNLGIDEESLQALRELNFRPYYGALRLTVRAVRPVDDKARSEQKTQKECP
jgi:hypothetical protein